MFKLMLITATLLLLPCYAIADVITVPAGGSVQAAIDAAQGGDTIVLQAGATYTGSLKLPVKSGTAFITITSSRASEIVGRVTPAQAHLLARVVSTYSTEPTFATVAGAHHFILKGLEIMPANGSGSTNPAYSIINLGESGAAQNTLEKVPYSIQVVKCWIHGGPTQEIQRGIALNSRDTDIIDSYISGIHGRGYDTQAIGGWNGPGPYKIINNFLEASGENIMFGGALASIPNLIPSDIQVRGNHLFKPLSWKKGDPAFVALPPLVGSPADHWTIKNLFELKNAKNVVIDGNLMENSWADAQVGYAVLFTVRGEGSNQMPWATIQNVDFTNNIIRNADHGIQTLGLDYLNSSTQATGLRIVNNSFESIKGIFFTLGGYHNVVIEHNTHSQGGNIMNLTGGQSPGFVYRNNATVRNPNGYGFKADGGGEGTAAFNQYCPTWTFAGNAVAQANPSTYPTGNHYPADLSGLQGLTGTDGLVPGYQGTNAPLPSPTPTPVPTPLPTPTPTASPTPSPTPPTGDLIRPVAAITSHVSGAVVSGTITVTANATDNVRVDSVYLVVDGQNKGGDATAPYSFSLNTTQLTEGLHAMFVRAWDSSGNAGDSAVVTITVSNGGTPTPTPTPVPSPAPTPSPTPVPSPSPSPTPTPVPSPSPGLPRCAPNQIIGNPAQCLCTTGVRCTGNNARCL